MQPDEQDKNSKKSYRKPEVISVLLEPGDTLMMATVCKGYYNSGRTHPNDPGPYIDCLNYLTQCNTLANT